MADPLHIGLVVDHPRRDLPTVVMTALALSRRGCRTSIVPLYEQGVDVPLLGLDALVTTFARPANRQLVERFSHCGLPVFVLDTEGGVLATVGPNSPESLARSVRDEGWGQLLAGYFFWGGLLRDAFTAAGAMPAERLHLTGCPRFDPTAEQWRAMLTFPQRDYVLVNTAFPAVNSRFTETGEDRQAMHAAGWDPAYVESLVVDSAVAMDRMITLIGNLARRLPHRHFLVRPHPFERQERYADAFAGLANVRVDGAGSVLNVIANSACVLQLNCSTAIEAIMLEKLPLSPDFVSTPVLRKHAELPNRASLLVDSEDRLVDILSDIPAATRAFDFDARYDALIAPYFHLRDGRAAERVADVLAALPRRHARPDAGEALRASVDRPRLLQRLQSAAALLLGSRRASLLRTRLQPRRAAKTIDVAPVRDLMLAATRAGGLAMPAIAHHVHGPRGLVLSSITVDPLPQ